MEMELCVACCESPESRRRSPLDEGGFDGLSSIISPGRPVNFTDSNFARALQRRELAARNPTYDSDRSLALLMNVSENDDVRPEVGDDIVRALFTCGLCDLSFGVSGTVAIDACAHQVCVSCLQAHVQASLEQLDGSAHVRCPIAQCQAHLSVAEIQRFAGAGAYERCVDRRLELHMVALPSDADDRFVRCPACTVAASVQPVTPRTAARRAKSEAPMLNDDGERLATPHRVHFVHHRFRCGACAAEFCGACDESPYHLGYSCDEWAEAKRAPHCRFCERILTTKCACAALPPLPVLEPAVGGEVGAGGFAAGKQQVAGAAHLHARAGRAALHKPAHARVPLRHAALSAAKRLVPPKVWQRLADARPQPRREPLGAAAGAAALNANAQPQHGRRPQRQHDAAPHGLAKRDAVIFGRAIAPRRRPAAEPVGEAAAALRGVAAPVRAQTSEGSSAEGQSVQCRRVVGRQTAWQTCCAPECVERGGDACLRALSCGHPCCGVRGEAEAECLGCLRPECAPAADGSHAESADDMCSICWSEPLGAAPSVRLGCSHVFHLHCVRERLRQRWAGRAINFEFAHCPLCKAGVAHKAIDALVAPHAENEKVLRSRALERLHYDGLDKAAAIVHEGGPFHNKPVEYALSRYSYYECAKCKLPYYAGLAACGADLDRREEPFDPREQVCGGCSSADGAPNTRCSVHGRENIEYKCRFCCNVASWYCWGNTHFCDTCHAEASTVQPKPCTCGKPHPPNGKEFALGCALCHAATSF